MDDLEQYLNDHASQTDSDDLEQYLNQHAGGEQASGVKQASKPTGSASASFAHNFMDAFHGAGELMQHVLPDRAMNAARQAAASVVGSIPGVSPDTVEDIRRPVSTAEYDAMERQRNADYAAQQSGREPVKITDPRTWNYPAIAGTLSNPMNWLAPEGKAASVLGRIGLAARNGALVSLWQPTEGDSTNFTQNKLSQIGTGAATGGLFAAGAEALAPALSKAAKWFGKDVSPQQATQAVDQIIQRAGTDPASVPQEFKAALSEQVQQHAKTNTPIDPDVVVRQTRAASLGMKLTEGQALQDPIRFAEEQKLRAVKAGSEITQLEARNQQAAIDRLSDWGAGGTNGNPRAPDYFSAGTSIQSQLKAKNEAMENAISNAYDNVRNSSGQAAGVDGKAFVDLVKGRLDIPEESYAFDSLPSGIQKIIGQIENGKLQLDVGRIQALDKAWGRMQRGTDDGSAQFAIGQARKALFDAPIKDQLSSSTPAPQNLVTQLEAEAKRLGLFESENPTPAQMQMENAWMQKYNAAKSAAKSGDISPALAASAPAASNAEDANASMSAYRLAKSLAKQRFSLLENVPAFDHAANDGDPAKFFEKYIWRATPAELSRVQSLVPESKDLMSKAAMRYLQEESITNQGVFSTHKFAGFMDDPVNVERYKLLFGENTTQNLKNLRLAAQDAFSPPRGTDVTSYKTGKSLAGLGEMAQGAAEHVLPAKVRAVVAIGKQIKNAASEAERVKQAVNSVPLSKTSPPRLQSNLGKIAAGAVPFSALLGSQRREQSSNEGNDANGD